MFLGSEQSQSPQKTKKSKRRHSLDLVRVNEDDNSFYLKHQKSCIEKERSERRHDIHEAYRTLHNIELVWKIWYSIRLVV